MVQGAVDVSVNRVGVGVNAGCLLLLLRCRSVSLLPMARCHGYGTDSPDGLSTMRTFSVMALSVLVFAGGSASAMEPLQISARVDEPTAPAAVHAAVTQEQASLNTRCHELRKQASAADQPLLENGPRHPRSAPLVSVGF